MQRLWLAFVSFPLWSRAQRTKGEDNKLIRPTDLFCSHNPLCLLSLVSSDFFFLFFFLPRLTNLGAAAFLLIKETLFFCLFSVSNDLPIILSTCQHFHLPLASLSVFQVNKPPGIKEILYFAFCSSSYHISRPLSSKNDPSFFNFTFVSYIIYGFHESVECFLYKTSEKASQKHTKRQRK